MEKSNLFLVCRIPLIPPWFGQEGSSSPSSTTPAPPSTIPGCFKSHPTSPLPGMGHLIPNCSWCIPRIKAGKTLPNIPKCLHSHTKESSACFLVHFLLLLSVAENENLFTPPQECDLVTALARVYSSRQITGTL